MSNNFNFNDYVVTETLNSQTAEFVGVEVNPVESQTKIPVIYGFRRIEPVRVLTSLNSRNTNELVCVYAISEGYCKGIHKIYIDGNDSGLSSANLAHRTIVSPATGAYAGIFTAEFIDGRDGTAATNTLNVGPSQLALQALNQKIEYPNLSYLVCTFRYSAGGPYKQLPKVTVDFFGRYIMDTYIISPPAFTYAYGTSPLSVLIDLLTNQQYGAGIGADKIDFDSLQQVKVYFDTLNATKYQPSAPVWETNWICNTDAELRSNVELLLETYNMMLYYSNGKYTFAVEQYPPALAATLDENSIIGSINVQYPSQETKFNRCTVEYIDPANNFQSNTVSWPPDGTVYNDYLADDAGIVLENRISVNSIIRRTEAGDLAQMTVRRSRDQTYYTFRATKDIYKYRVGDILTIDLDYPPILDTVILTELNMNSDFTFDVQAASWRSGFYPENFGSNYAVTTRPPSLVPGTIGISRPPTNPGVPPPPPPPSFTVSADRSSVVEGQTFTFTITASTNLNGQTVFYDLTGANITGTDFNPPLAALSNSLTFVNTTCSLTLTIANDAITEGNETLTFTARLQSTRELIGTTSVLITESVAAQPAPTYWLNITTPPTGTQVPQFLRYPPPTDAGLGTTALNPTHYIGPLNAAKSGVPTNLVNTQGIGCRVTSRATQSGFRYALLDVFFHLVDRNTATRDTNRQIFCTWGTFVNTTQNSFQYIRRSGGVNTVYRYNPTAPVYLDKRQSQKTSPSPVAPGEILTAASLPVGGIKLLQLENGIYSNVDAPLSFIINAGTSLTNSNSAAIPNCLGSLTPTALGALTLTFKFFELSSTSSTVSPIEIGHARYTFNLATANTISPAYLVDSRAQFIAGTGLTTAPF